MKKTLLLLLMGTMSVMAQTGYIRVDEDHGTHKVFNLPDPLTNQEAATKHYVDLHASSPFNPGNLTDSTSDGITITGGTNAVNGAGTTIAQRVSDTTHNGYLSALDNSAFNQAVHREIGFSSYGVVQTGQKGYFTINHYASIAGWSITCGGSSPTITIDVWMIAPGTALPTVSNSITASAKPALTTGNAIRSATLTGWTTNVIPGNIFGYNVDAVSNCNTLTFALELDRL